MSFPPGKFQLRARNVVCRDCHGTLQYVFDENKKELVLGFEILQPGKIRCSNCLKISEVSDYFQTREQVLAWRIKAYGGTFSVRKNEETEL